MTPTPKLPYAIYDVFTDRALSGNPLAVVFDADPLTTEQMQAIAAEFNLSETIFICGPENGAHTAQVRIFTPKNELPFAGHPTVGGAIAITQRAGSGQGEDMDRILVLEEKLGLVRVAVHPGAAAYAEFDVPRLPTLVDTAVDRDALAAALGLSASDLLMENHEPVVALAGNAFLFVPVSGLGAMASISVNAALLNDALPTLDGGVHAECFAYCRETVSPDCGYHARMFAPHMGIPEDPATGSAVANFSAVIQRFDGLVNGPNVVWVEQGIEMGRPSRIRLEMSAQDGVMTSVRIGGHAVKVAEGMLF